MLCIIKWLKLQKKTWEKNGVEGIKFNKEKWVNEKDIEAQLEHSNLREATSKYPLNLRKQRQELQNCDKQPCRRFLRDAFAVQIIMDCRTIPAVNFNTRLGFNQHDPIMTQEQSVLSKITTLFPAEQNNSTILCFRLLHRCILFRV